MEFNFKKKEEGLEDVSAAMLSTIHSAPKDVKETLADGLPELERTGLTYLEALCTKLYEEYPLKRMVPKPCRGNEFATDVFFDGAKKLLLLQEFHKLDAVIMDIESQKSDVITINFRNYKNFDYATYSTALAYLRTQGWVFDWKTFDRNNMSIYDLGECRFKKAEPVSGKELIESTAASLESKITRIHGVQRWENSVTIDDEIKKDQTLGQ